MSVVRQWESLAALIRDISNLQEQHQHLNERLWRSGHTVQQLTVQVNQGKANLAQSNHTVRQTQEELQQQRQYFQREQKEHDYAKKSLAHEFSVHAQTEKSLASEREMNHKLISLCNQFDLTNANMGSGVAVPEGLKLGSILEENRALKRATGEYKARIEKDKHTIDSSEATIETLKREKQDMLDALDEKEIELSTANDQLSALCQECCSDDSEDEEGVQIETALLGKRKRLGE